MAKADKYTLQQRTGGEPPRALTEGPVRVRSGTGNFLPGRHGSFTYELDGNAVVAHLWVFVVKESFVKALTLYPATSPPQDAVGMLNRFIEALVSHLTDSAPGHAQRPPA